MFSEDTRPRREPSEYFLIAKCLCTYQSVDYGADNKLFLERDVLSRSPIMINGSVKAGKAKIDGVETKNSRPDEEQNVELVIVVMDTHLKNWAMVVHTRNTPTTDAAMMGPFRLQNIALFTVFDLADVFGLLSSCLRTTGAFLNSDWRSQDGMKEGEDDDEPDEDKSDQFPVGVGRFGSCKNQHS